MSVETFAAATVQVKEYAEMAISSVQETLQLVFDRDDLRSALIGMPTYFHGIINFAAAFLLKTARTTFIGPTSIDTLEVLRLVQKCIGELQSQRAAQQHLVYQLSSGARRDGGENGDVVRRCRTIKNLTRACSFASGGSVV